MAAAWSDFDALFGRERGRLRLNLRLTPNAKHTGVTGTAEDAHKQAYLKISVTSVPEGGKANAALIKVLSKEWKLPKSSLSIVKGHTDRRKVIEIGGNMDMVLTKLSNWYENRVRDLND